MADVVICFATDAEAVAGRLAGALSHAGYSIWSEEGASPEGIADRIGDVDAAIVLWSPAARASDWTRAEANYARGQKKLVQASIDPEPPPMPFHPAAVAPLAGWEGEPDHPGWRRIEAEVEGLCGRRRSSAATTASAPARAAPPVRVREREGRGPPMTLLAILFLLVVAAGAFFWMRSGPPHGSEEPEPAKQAAAPQPKPAAPQRTFAGPPPAVLPPPGAFEPGQPEFENPEFEAPEPPAAEPPRPAPRASGPRINRRNAENMRLFCQRAGRGTPQCRTFQRQLRNQSR